MVGVYGLGFRVQGIWGLGFRMYGGQNATPRWPDASNL